MNEEFPGAVPEIPVNNVNERPKKTGGDLRQTNRLVKVCDRGAT
jgi:hypothetical protein